jgi:outer membrane lipoprotein-sorting protein
MAGPRTSLQKAFRSGLMLVVLAFAEGAAAQTDQPWPLPHLRPLRGGDAAAAATGQAAAEPVLDAAFDPSSPFTREQQKALSNISAYFNSFHLMEGKFVQIGPNGEQSEGVFYLNRPGRIRFHYNPPARLDVISDGSSVAVKDGRSGTQDLYPLSKTPLRYLLAERIDLTSSSIVSEVREESDLISLVIVEKSSFADGKLTMIFDRGTFELRQWQVTDAQGLNTSVAIFDTVTGKPQDGNLFRISVNN